MPARPFRINAGPVHQYVRMADGSTKYLSEVQSGDQLQLYSSDTGAGSRAATVGRIKIEPRPCLMVEFEVGGGGRAQTFLQQAETVRLAGALGPLPVTRARIGDEVLVRPDSMGTHVGQRISVAVDER